MAGEAGPVGKESQTWVMNSAHGMTITETVWICFTVNGMGFPGNHGGDL